MISLNLTVHNKGFLLQDVLERIKKYTLGSYELIIVLDGCTDNSEGIVKNFVHDNKQISIKVLYCDNVFETKANNAAAKKSTGDYIIIIQDDVLINEPFWNKRLLQPFELSDVFAVTGNTAHNWEINPNSRHIHEHFNRNDCWCDILNHIHHANRNTIDRNVFAVRDCVNRAPLAINRRDLETLNYFDEEFCPQDMDDHDLCFRMHKQLNKKVGCYWIDYICKPEWGSTRGADLKPKPWLFEAQHKNTRILLQRHKDIINTHVQENIKL